MMHSPPLVQPSDTQVPGIYSSEHISLDVPAVGQDGRPPPVKYASLPAYHSPLRHHKRAASSTRQVKETLNARSEYSNSEDDGTAQHRINQYLVRQEIGRGSFGAVHLAVDQYGQEYAVKEFSKSRLRKRAQSNLLRRPSARRRRQGALAAGLGFNSPLHRHSTTEENNSLDLIKEEIAIMKKLNHPNLVSLIEVLDDPEEDSLYMVMEMCKKGVVMQVGLEERADPYPEEQCRCWFRDMVLGLEYLHAQGIIHRDIKPDNCLITDDDILKIVDFGVSEMFDKQDQMKTAKSAGSPAFMPPELCVARHGEVDGRAVDIWSMGVTLFCLLFGRIPFEKHGMIELYQAIRMDQPEYDECDPDLRDLLAGLLEKDPQKRITMEQAREHPWVTREGSDPLLAKSENVAILVEPPTDEELNAAITGNMGHLVTVVRAVKRFKQLLFRRRPERLEGILGSASRIVQPPLSMRPSALRKTKSQDTDDRRPIESAFTTEGVHRDIDIDDDVHRAPQNTGHTAHTKPAFRAGTGTNSTAGKGPVNSSLHSTQPVPVKDGNVIHENMSHRPSDTKSIALPTSINSSAPATSLGKGHAHNPLEDTLFLNIGTGEDYTSADDHPCVSESPGAVDINVYETAYREEVDRIVQQREDIPGRRPTLYLTRRVEDVKAIIADKDAIFDHGKSPAEIKGELKGGFKSFVEKTKNNIEARGELQKLNEGKEGRLSRITRNVREAKRAVEEEREIIRREDREREKGKSRSSTPVASVRGLSRSVTPVAVEK